MRIISGKYKNRCLKSPKGGQTRPTSAKIRGSIFDRLQNQIEGAFFLDLFAGSGSMGIEALSRGAKEVVFVEWDQRAVRCIHENLNDLEIKASIVSLEARKGIQHLAKKKKLFEVIFVDPPYEMDVGGVLHMLPSLLSENGIVILEQRKNAFIESFTLKEIDKRKLGDTIVYYFSHP